MNSANVYSPYGHGHTGIGSTVALGFNGQFFHAAPGCYALGNGLRFYNPRLMRFVSPDTLSPFLKGGINAYAYCLNDPVNAQDPSGRWPFFKNLAPKAVAAARSVKDAIFPAPSITLRNNQAKKLATEVLESRKAYKAVTVDYTVVSNKSRLDLLDWKPKHKFVLTDKNEFAIFSADTDALLPTHASLAERLGLAQSDSVVSAGYIGRQNGEYFIDNFSGHYQPPFERLYVAEEYLSTLGIEVRLIRADLDFNG